MDTESSRCPVQMNKVERKWAKLPKSASAFTYMSPHMRAHIHENTHTREKRGGKGNNVMQWYANEVNPCCRLENWGIPVITSKTEMRPVSYCSSIYLLLFKQFASRLRVTHSCYRTLILPSIQQCIKLSKVKFVMKFITWIFCCCCCCYKVQTECKVLSSHWF